MEALELQRMPFMRPNEITAMAEMPNRDPVNGSLAATFARVLFDHGVRMKHNPHVIQLVKRTPGAAASERRIRCGIRDGDTIRISANGRNIVVRAKLDEGVAEGTVVLPLGFH